MSCLHGYTISELQKELESRDSIILNKEEAKAILDYIEEIESDFEVERYYIASEKAAGHALEKLSKLVDGTKK